MSPSVFPTQVYDCVRHDQWRCHVVMLQSTHHPTPEYDLGNITRGHHVHYPPVQGELFCGQTLHYLLGSTQQSGPAHMGTLDC